MRLRRLAPIFASLLLLVPVGCRRVVTGRSSEHPAPSEAELGLGFDSLSGLTRGKCVERKLATSAKRKGLTSREQVFYASSTIEIIDQLGLSAGLSLGLKVFGLDFGFENITRTVSTSESAFAVIRIEMEAPARSLSDYRLTNEARELLRREGSMRFYERCGDGFIAATEEGGVFIGIIAVQSTTREDLEQTTGKGGVSFLGFGASGGTSKKTRDYLEKHRARYFVLQQGGDIDGWGSVEDIQSVDRLVQRASKFRAGVGAGRTTTTSIIVKPYQVASNPPRRAAFPDLFDQRRSLGELAHRYDDFQRAHQQVSELLGAGDCARPKELRTLQKTQAEYAAHRDDIRKRAEQCLNEPERDCSTRRLDSLDRRGHERALSLCKDHASAPGGVGVSRVKAASSVVKGVDSPCALWHLSQVTLSIARTKPSGAAWDADGSPPDVVASVLVDKKYATSVPKHSNYDVAKTLENFYVRADQVLDVSITDVDAMFDDPIAGLSIQVPALIPDGKLTLQSGGTRATFASRCVE